jgi:hypothetical protein
MAREKTDIAIQVEKEHECIQRDMRRIKDEVTREISFDDFPDWRLEFLWRMRDFRLHVLKHIDLEEEGGFMHEILEEAPEVFNAVKKLEDEHEEIIHLMDDILESLRKMEYKDDDKISAIREQVLKLIKIIRAHEEEESELIQKAYYQVYGYPA